MVLIKRKAREFLFGNYVSFIRRPPLDLLRCDSAQRSFFHTLGLLTGWLAPTNRPIGWMEKLEAMFRFADADATRITRLICSNHVIQVRRTVWVMDRLDRKADELRWH